MTQQSLFQASLSLLIALAFLSEVSSAAGDAGPSAPPLPNIVVFLVDDMGVMDTSVPFLTDSSGQAKRYPHNDYFRTPNMERLAARGIRFNTFNAMSVCSPTRVTLMTGQNPARHHVTNWIQPVMNNAGTFGAVDWNWKGLSKTDVTLARLLRERGYRTIHVGKGHFGPNGTEGSDPSNLGFDVNVGGAAIGAPGSYYGKENFGFGTKRANSAVPHLEKYHGTDTFLTEALTLEAKDHLSAAVKAGKPFYLYLAHYAVHAPFQSDPRFASLYANSGKPAPAQAFATMVEGMDKSLGDILDHLERLGVAENTLVMFLGDNGSDAPLGDTHSVACAAPLRGKKGTHYEGGTRVPFIAAWAKASEANPWQKRLPIPAGVIQAQLASVCDIFPTLVHLVGAKIPDGHIVDGHRLDTLLAGKPDPQKPQTFLMHYPHDHRSKYWTSYRDGRWKVIYHYRPSAESENTRYQLYDLHADPFEQKNLAETHPQELRRMMQALMTALEAHQAQYPIADDRQTRLKPQLPS